PHESFTSLVGAGGKGLDASVSQEVRGDEGDDSPAVVKLDAPQRKHGFQLPDFSRTQREEYLHRPGPENLRPDPLRRSTASFQHHDLLSAAAEQLGHDGAAAASTPRNERGRPT